MSKWLGYLVVVIADKSINLQYKKEDTSCEHFFNKYKCINMDDVSNKRQRIATSNSEFHITDLPDGLLVGIASYLAKPSVALFALAMNSSTYQQTQTSKAIISSTNWNTLDINDIEKSLAAKLSDDNFDKILRCKDVASNMKILKLAGCINITGSGLDTLRSSTAIQQIDLSLVGKHEVPVIEPEPLLSGEVVIPILDDIISRGRASSLKQLEFPKKWRNAAITEMEQFFVRYDDYLTNQRYCCSSCNRALVEEDGEDEWICRSRLAIWYGTQNFTCSSCLVYFCQDCREEDGITNSNWCKKCEKEYCKYCVAMAECELCDHCICNECEEMRACEGEDCEIVLCGACSEKRKCRVCNHTRCMSCISSYQCTLGGCNKVICRDCIIHGEGGRCDACNKVFCSTECQYLECSKDAAKACSTCSIAAASAFRRKLQECKKENEELCQGMDDLYKKYMNVDGDGDN